MAVENQNSKGLSAFLQILYTSPLIFVKRQARGADNMSNADKLKSIYLYERVISEANAEIDRLQSDMRRIKDKIKRSTEERDEAALLLSSVKEAIHGIKNPLHRELLERYYLHGQTWERISEEMHYSATQIYKLRKQALNEIDLDFLPDTEQSVYCKNNGRWVCVEKH